VPPAIAAAGIGAAGSLAGGLMGAAAKSDAAQAQQNQVQAAAAGLQGIHVPTIEEQRLALEQIRNAGNLTPEMEQTFQQNPSLLNAYIQNPEATTAQMQALQKLQQVGNQGGLTAVDKAQLNEIQNATNRNEQANRGAIAQNFAQRGMGGSGVELATQLAGNQASGENAANQGFNVAAQAQQRALQAIQAAGGLGGQIEAQQFGEAGQKSAAQNAINQFNTANQQNVAGQNVQRGNYAQERNLNNQQQLNQANTGIANQQQIYNTGLAQQQFGNELQKQGGIANIQTGKAAMGAQEAKGQAGAALGSAIGGTVGQLGTAVGNALTPTAEEIASKKKVQDAYDQGIGNAAQ